MIETAILSIFACSGIAQLWQYAISPAGVLRSLGALMSGFELFNTERDKIEAVAKIEHTGKPYIVVEHAINVKLWERCLKYPNLTHLLGFCPTCFGFWLSLIAAFTQFSHSPIHGLAVIGGTFLLTKFTNK